MSDKTTSEKKTTHSRKRVEISAQALEDAIATTSSLPAAAAKLDISFVTLNRLILPERDSQGVMKAAYLRGFERAGRKPPAERKSSSPREGKPAKRKQSAAEKFTGDERQVFEVIEREGKEGATRARIKGSTDLNYDRINIALDSLILGDFVVSREGAMSILHYYLPEFAPPKQETARSLSPAEVAATTQRQPSVSAVAAGPQKEVTAVAINDKDVPPAKLRADRPVAAETAAPPDATERAESPSVATRAARTATRRAAKKAVKKKAGKRGSKKAQTSRGSRRRSEALAVVPPAVEAAPEQEEAIALRPAPQVDVVTAMPAMPPEVTDALRAAQVEMHYVCFWREPSPKASAVMEMVTNALHVDQNHSQSNGTAHAGGG